MKKKLIISVLLVFMYMIIASSNSCTSGNAQSSNDPYEYQYNVDTTIRRNSITSNYYKAVIEQDTQKKIVIKKEIKPMEIDTTWKTRRNSLSEQLEKTSDDLKTQQKTLDSMIVFINK